LRQKKKNKFFMVMREIEETSYNYSCLRPKKNQKKGVQNKKT